ncbi:MAG TPA: HepT-like ribonuclease domain-containing protein [Stellaceae bacterium]|jgi:uncharacterized protein with HEPN domain|nr:HepT-like ribonuclease domain-containing protein [Stellaceae bacterium]
MITTEAAKYLWDARTAAQRIIRFIGDRDYDGYMADDLIQAAVERQFEIIGEALAGLRRMAPAIAETIPDISQIIAFRNVLIHSYATVDVTLVWGVIENDLPTLTSAIDRLLGQAP